MTTQPEWWQVSDPEMATLSDEELREHNERWSQNLQRYRAQACDPHLPRQAGQRGPAYSAWWAGKILDRGIRERNRRRHRLLTQLASELARRQQTLEHTHADDR